MLRTNKYYEVPPLALRLITSGGDYINLFKEEKHALKEAVSSLTANRRCPWIKVNFRNQENPEQTNPGFKLENRDGQYNLIHSLSTDTFKLTKTTPKGTIQIEGEKNQNILRSLYNHIETRLSPSN